MHGKFIDEPEPAVQREMHEFLQGLDPAPTLVVASWDTDELGTLIKAGWGVSPERAAAFLRQLADKIDDDSAERHAGWALRN